jgi:hypothetical protein
MEKIVMFCIRIMIVAGLPALIRGWAHRKRSSACLKAKLRLCANCGKRGVDEIVNLHLTAAI